jgi:uncharacterized protein (TIGR02271 family)
MPSNSNFVRRAEGYAEDLGSSAVSTTLNAGKAWWDLMLDLQRSSLESFSSYSPISDTRIIAGMPRQSNGVQVIPVGEERLNVATRTVQGETTRVRRRVIAQPVEQQVTLREEKVIVERRAPTGTDSKPDVLTETVIEMSDSRQVPTVWKSLHVAEEVVLRKQVTERTEKVRETVRRDVVDVEHARPVVSAPAPEVEGRANPITAPHEAEVEHRAPARPESRPNANGQHDVPRDTKPGPGMQGPAAQRGGRKS